MCICALRRFLAGLVITTRSSALAGSSLSLEDITGAFDVARVDVSVDVAIGLAVPVVDVSVDVGVDVAVDANIASSGDTVRSTLVDGVDVEGWLTDTAVD